MITAGGRVAPYTPRVATTVRDPLVGHLLDERYRIQSRIARGGMATVYRAVDTRLDRQVAVKVMHAGLAADEEFVARFIREAKATARLSHPNVVAVYDQGRDASTGGDTVFLAMEYVAGRTLRDLLTAQGALSPRQAFAVMEPVLAALGAAHAAGLVHRDVKPENVLLADDGRIKVADFGLARAVTSTSTAATQGLLIGTVAYLAPEQVSDGTADQRTDVYAAGILLFELLTGTRPFDGASPLQVAFRHVHDDVPAPSTRVPGLPAALDELVTRAAARDPRRRPPDATRLLADVVAVRRALSADELDRSPAVVDVEQPTVVVPLGGPSPTMVLPAADGAGAGSGVRAEPTGLLAPDTADVADTADAAEARDGPKGPAGASAAPARRSGRRRWWLVLAVLLAGLLGTGWYLAAGPGAYTATPSLLELTRAEAEARAADAGLSVEWAEPEYSESVSAGEVISTDPAPTERVRKGGTVVAVVSRGPERYPVPDLRGRTRAEAERLLGAGPLTLGEIAQRYDEQVPRGRVVATSPPPQERVRPDTPVDLVISRGREPIPVPDVTGRTLEEAQTALRRARLGVEVERRYDEQVPAGRVISQAPADGTLFRGNPVRLVLSLGPPLVEVPDVRDQKVDQARATLEAAGFVVSTRGTSILDRVIVQSPAGGRSVPKGSTITLTTI